MNVQINLVFGSARIFYGCEDEAGADKREIKAFAGNDRLTGIRRVDRILSDEKFAQIAVIIIDVSRVASVRIVGQRKRVASCKIDNRNSCVTVVLADLLRQIRRSGADLIVGIHRFGDSAVLSGADQDEQAGGHRKQNEERGDEHGIHFTVGCM